VDLTLCVGDGEDAWPLPRDASRVERFVSIGPDGLAAVAGRHGSDPAGVARFGTGGDYVVAYESNRAHTMQTGTQFDEYLAEVGLHSIAAARRKRGDGASVVVREAYSRHAKTLLAVDDAPGLPRDRAVGLRLELILETAQPRRDGTEASLRLVHLGRPLAGALVTATAFGSPDLPLRARSSTDGRVSFVLRRDRAWRINAVHMVRGDRELGADWESLWASLVFELPGRTTQRRDGLVRCSAPVASSTVNASSNGHEIVPPPPPSLPPSSPQLVSPVTVVPARLSR
jgi:hypothetical protein